MTLSFRNDNFIERSVFSAVSFLKESVFSDEIASRKGFLQFIDPRVKAVSFALFLISALIIKSIPLLAFMYLTCLLLACSSGIQLGFFLRRTWLFIPLFSLFIAIPALFSIISPGEPLFILRLAGIRLIISRQGLSAAVLFLLRVVTSVSLAILLSLVTRHNELLSVLRTFKIPQVFVMTLGMCYRYIYLFAGILENTYFAIKSRAGGIRADYKQGRGIAAWNMASLWQRSRHLNEEVYKAMLSRGYTGEPRLLDEFRINSGDWLWLFFAALISVLVIYLDKIWAI